MDAHLPEDLDPDTYDGSAWLSVVPFTNVAVRPRWFPERLGYGFVPSFTGSTARTRAVDTGTPHTKP